jgi:hypothetical protein
MFSTEILYWLRYIFLLLLLAVVVLFVMQTLFRSDNR